VSPLVEKPPAVLVVDDQPANLVSAEAVLAPLECRVATAASGAEALARVLTQDYALVLMDVHMPELDGYQTVELLQQQEASRDIPVIFLTAAHDSPERIHRAYALGAVDHITKPYDPDVLRGKVRAFLLIYERAARAERRRRERSDRAKDLFLGALGHDLRNPLNTIVMGAHLTLQDAKSGRAAQLSVARRIERASLRMTRMIEDILDLTRQQFAGGIALSRREMNLGDVCQAIVDEARLVHPEREVTLALDGDLAGVWDQVRIARVVANLLSNAIDHGEAEPVRVQARGHRDGVTLAVMNRGVPIDPEMLPSLFDPFQRGETSGGLGLGLYIVREIVQAHCGTVEVQSSFAEGTTFTVTLPRPALGGVPAGSIPPTRAA
jgi:signal transduction histidine kinase